MQGRYTIQRIDRRGVLTRTHHTSEHAAIVKARRAEQYGDYAAVIVQQEPTGRIVRRWTTPEHTHCPICQGVTP